MIQSFLYFNVFVFPATCVCVKYFIKFFKKTQHAQVEDSKQYKKDTCKYTPIKPNNHEHNLKATLPNCAGIGTNK